jgi:hypothetical protein
LADRDTTDAEAASAAGDMEVLLYEAVQDRKAALIMPRLALIVAAPGAKPRRRLNGGR